MGIEPVGIPVVTRVHVLLGIYVVDTTVVAVGVVGHEELHIGLLGLQPHCGWRCSARAARVGPFPGSAATPSRGAQPRPARLASPRLGRAARAVAASRCRFPLPALAGRVPPRPAGTLGGRAGTSLAACQSPKELGEAAR